MCAHVKGYNLKELRLGVHAGVPIALGYLPIAIAFGLLAKSAHISLLITFLLSSLVFAGASQFVAVQMLIGGTALFNIVILTFILNLRHFLMSATLSTRIEEKSNGKLALIAFGLTDESFSVASLSKQEKLSFPFLIGLNFTGYLSWNVGTVLGYLVGAGLPQDLQSSMGIALYAMFIGLLIPAIRTSHRIAWIVIFAAILNTILINLLQPGPAIIVTTIAISAIAARFLPDKESE